MTDERKNGATVGEALGLVSRAEMDAAQAQIAAAQKEMIASAEAAHRTHARLEAEVAALKFEVAERDKDLAALREAIINAQDTRDLAVREACEAKTRAGQLERKVAEIEKSAPLADAVVEDLKAKNAELWGRLRKREDRRTAWEAALVVVASELGVLPKDVKEPGRARVRCIEAIRVLRTGKPVTEPVAATP
jgi:hypothetical protein